MTEAQIKAFEHRHVLDFVIRLPEKSASFRVNLVQQERGIAVAFRSIPEKIPTLDAIYAPWALQGLADSPSGFIVFAGSEGSGRSTTISAFIEYINIHQSKHIITLEDPIEYVFQSKTSLIDQRHLSFNHGADINALKITLRASPNILVIGEIRDREMVRFALSAAETGQLVITTVHANSAVTAIRRMVDVFPSSEKTIIRHLIASVLQGVVYQQLVSKIGGGRIAAFEVLLATLATRNLIREDNIEQLYSVMEMNKGQGMCTMRSSLQHLIEKKIIKDDALITRSEEVSV